MLITATNPKTGIVETKTEHEWSEITGMYHDTIRTRVYKLKWSGDEAVSLPPYAKRHIKPKPKKTREQVYAEALRAFCY